MQVDKFFLSTLLSGYYLSTIATIQIGVCILYLSREFYHTDIIFGMASVVHSDRVPHNNIIEQAQPIVA